MSNTTAPHRCHAPKYTLLEIVACRNEAVIRATEPNSEVEDAVTGLHALRY